LEFHTQVILGFDFGLDFKHGGKRKRPALLQLIGFDLRPGNDLKTPFFNHLAKGFLYKMGTNLSLDLVTIDPLQHVARYLTGTKTFDAHSLSKVLIGAGKFARDRFRRQLDADFSLDGT
jgi:hypothetical protein